MASQTWQIIYAGSFRIASRLPFALSMEVPARRYRDDALFLCTGKIAARSASQQFQTVPENIEKRFRLCAGRWGSIFFWIL